MVMTMVKIGAVFVTVFSCIVFVTVRVVCCVIRPIMLVVVMEFIMPMDVLMFGWIVSVGMLMLFTKEDNKRCRHKPSSYCLTIGKGLRQDSYRN